MSNPNWKPKNVGCDCTDEGDKSIWIGDKEKDIYYCAGCGEVQEKPEWKPKKNKTKVIGKMLNEKDLYITIHVGTAGHKEVVYRLALMVNQSPIITSEKTKKRFNLPWNDIINMAINAGIDK